MKTVRIIEVDGRAVKPRVSLGGARNYIEAGEVREVEDDVADAGLASGVFQEVESGEHPVLEPIPDTELDEEDDPETEAETEPDPPIVRKKKTSAKK